MSREISEQASINTDRELYREDLQDPLDPDNFYAPSIHVTQDGRIGMSVGGMVIVMSIRNWHNAVRKEIEAAQPSAERDVSHG